MKYLIIAAVFTLTIFNAHSQGMEFFHGTWEEALAKASEDNKLIFVDAYTTWCGPCKRMSKNVFPQASVGDYYNAHFINVKIDMEKDPGRKFGQKYPVTAYPTFYYIDPDGNVVLTTKGGRQAGDFISLGELAVKKFDGSAKYKALYDQGIRDYETVYNYIKALNKSGKSSVKVANEYFATQNDLTTTENLDMLMVATTRVDSRVFGLFEGQKSALVKKEGEEQVDNVIRTAAYNTGMAAIKYESLELIDESFAVLQKHLPAEADEFATSSRMQYALKMQDVDMYADYAKTFVKKYAGDDSKELAQVAQDIILHFPSHPDCVELGTKAAKKALNEERNQDNVITYATMVYLGGDKEEALKVLTEAMSDPDLVGESEKLSQAKQQFERA